MNLVSGVVVDFTTEEGVTLDPATLNRLYQQLGPQGAESLINRAMEELAVRLVSIESLPDGADPRVLSKSSRALAAIADQIGMVTLARVALSVSDTALNGDAATLAATLARMMRVGHRSLNEVWEVQDMSV